MPPIDTSGYVLTTSQFPPPGDGALKLGWSDLDDFTRGYIEAVFADFMRQSWRGEVIEGSKPPGFRDLAPETLALILRDCQFWRDFGAPNTAAEGARVWRMLQEGKAGVMGRHPLTPTLADDGFVYLREGQ